MESEKYQHTKSEPHQHTKSKPHQHLESKQTESEHCNVGRSTARQWPSILMLPQGPV